MVHVADSLGAYFLTETTKPRKRKGDREALLVTNSVLFKVNQKHIKKK